MPGNRTILFFLVTALLAGSSCKKDFEEINTDPNQITEGQINFNYLFTNAQLLTSGNTDGNGYEDWRNNLIYSGCMIQHLSSTFPYWDGDKYLYSATYNSAYWDENYPNSIADIVDVLQHVRQDTAQANFYQIGRIFKAFMFQRLTDMYGDCPYSQAGLGYISGITSPRYDKQQDIYLDLLKELQEAALALDPGKPNTVGAADLLYGGDPLAWKRFAYSEMVRVAMRLSKVDPGLAQQWVQTAVQGGVIINNGGNAILQHQNVTGTPVTNGNGLILLGNDPNGYRLNVTFVNFLRTAGDPRLPYLATVCANPSQPADKGDTSYNRQLGQPGGYDPPNSGSARDLVNAPGWPGDQNRYSIVNRYTFARLDAPTFFLTCAETQLLLAEAAQRGWITGAPASYYTTGVRAAMSQLAAQAGAGPADATIDTWLGDHPYNPALGLEQINEQYWIAGFMDENECFANWRRSGYPSLIPVNYPGNVTGGAIPRRFTYPPGEASNNTANYNEAVSRLANGDKMT
ncbi:MAG TPA: SusD/RagB family nutrient-binding outer membrane lipoprotein, partial [Puia sp.]|nr:SusD/RagB family nutrient-binding outer membrane lipoprotein [Puia sp.]